MLMALNAYHDLAEFTLAPFEDGTQWVLELDTNIPGGQPERNCGSIGATLLPARNPVVHSVWTALENVVAEFPGHADMK
jgi:hypothetical protein